MFRGRHPARRLELRVHGADGGHRAAAAAAGYADPTLDSYVNMLLTALYSNPLYFTASGQYAITVGYEMALPYLTPM